MRFNRKHISIALCLIILSALSFSCLADSQKTINLFSMDLTKMTSGWGKPIANKTIENKPITMAGKVYDNGVGTHATSIMFIDLKASAKRFTATVGLDDEINNASQASMFFQIIGDEKELIRTPIIKAGSKPIEIDIDLKGIKTLILVVRPDKDGRDFDHASSSAPTKTAEISTTQTGQTQK